MLTIAARQSDEAAALLAMLPEPPDPDLPLARQIVIDTLDPESHRRCDCRDKIAAGEWDRGQKVRIALAAFAKFRTLVAGDAQ
ncbi:hypothetical protein ACLBWH_12205 [Sphingomonas sp. M6A6_1c]